VGGINVNSLHSNCQLSIVNCQLSIVLGTAVARFAKSRHTEIETRLRHLLRRV
jgi:hypothetical protein